MVCKNIAASPSFKELFYRRASCTFPIAPPPPDTGTNPYKSEQDVFGRSNNNENSGSGVFMRIQYKEMEPIHLLFSGYRGIP